MNKVKVKHEVPLMNKQFIKKARITKSKRPAKKLPFKIQLTEFNLDESINRINELIKQTKYALSKK